MNVELVLVHHQAPDTVRDIHGLRRGVSRQVTDNGATLSTPGVAQFGSASTVANIAKDYASTPWTVGGAGKRCNRVTILYEI